MPNPQGWIKILEKILQISLVLLRTSKISIKKLTSNLEIIDWHMFNFNISETATTTTTTNW